MRQNGTAFRYNFPPEVVQAREEIYTRVRELLAEQTWEGVRQARRLHIEWLEKYPNDYVALDAGEVLLMAEEAYLRTEKPSARVAVGARDAAMPIA